MGPVIRIARPLVDYARLLCKSRTKKVFCRRKSKVCLVLYYFFVEEMAPKCGCLVDFITTNLLIMHAYMHACTSLFFV